MLSDGLSEHCFGVGYKNAQLLCIVQQSFKSTCIFYFYYLQTFEYHLSTVDQRQAITSLRSKWARFAASSRTKEGLAVLDAVIARQLPWHYTDSFFNDPGKAVTFFENIYLMINFRVPYQNLAIPSRGTCSQFCGCSSGHHAIQKQQTQ